MLSPSDLRCRPLPSSWHFLAGIDTGTYMSATFWLFPPDAEVALCVYEQPNYRYVGGEIELLDYSIPGWSAELLSEFRHYCPGKTRMQAWADQNSQFKTELARYNITLLSNLRKLELRVEIAREYFANRRAILAPWLKVLPYELEHARWPDESTSAGRFDRIKHDDHTLDTAEHVLSRRPRHPSQIRRRQETFLERHLRENPMPDVNPHGDPHLGRLG